MATRTGAGDLRVVDRDDRFPGVYRVTVFANVGRRDMSLRFASRICSVMAIDAQSLNPHVVKTGGEPCYTRDMAHTAFLFRWQVTAGFADGVDIVMAG